MKKLRAIAIHLPQFYPTEQNDLWWGRGFTEWTNVAKARPLFRGHDQPHVPADLGFYDLRMPEARAAQAELAAQYGLHGFCYYHYWFHGKRLLEKPVDDILRSGKPDFPFCLFWANETWSRRWLGDEKEVLMDQVYSEEDDRAHARYLAQAFADERYIRVNGRPVFIVYRPMHLPDVKATLERIREECVKQGVGDPYLIGSDSRCGGSDCRAMGFDSTLRFEPKLGALPGNAVDKLNPRAFLRNLRRGIVSADLKVYDYTEACRAMRWYRPDYPIIPSICVGFDNTARRGRRGLILVNNTPQAFRRQLEEELAHPVHPERDDDLFFINAWNEWAEGNHLEPDLAHGLNYLEQVKAVFGGPADKVPAVEIPSDAYAPAGAEEGPPSPRQNV